MDTVIREHREITSYNERVIEESKKSTDPYDIFCKGCTAETRALPRDKYVFRGDLFDAKRKTDGESRDAGVLYLDDEELLCLFEFRDARTPGWSEDRAGGRKEGATGKVSLPAHPDRCQGDARYASASARRSV